MIVFIMVNYSINLSDVICLILQITLCLWRLSTSRFNNIYVKWVSATSSSSFISPPFSFNVITSSFLTFLFAKNGDINFQKLLFVKGWFSADFGKYCFLAVFVTFVHLFFICVRAKTFSLDDYLLHLFLILYLVIIALLSSFVIEGVWFPLTCFCFSGAWLSRVDQKMFIKLSYLTPPLHSLLRNFSSSSYKKSLVSKYLKLL